MTQPSSGTTKQDQPEQPQQPATAGEPSYRRRRSRTPLVIALAALTVLALIAIIFAITRGGGTGAGGENGSAAGGTGTGGELTIGLQLEPTNLDIRQTGGVALDQILIDNVYQGLIGLRPGTVSEYVPVLAKELPEVSADGLSYTFSLREGITFASGNPLTAQDVVDSLSAEAGPASLTTALGMPVSVRAQGESEVVIELSAPHSQLMWHLANRPGLVFETAFTGDLAHSTNGTGPFTLTQWKQGDSITFTARDDYWGETPALDTVVWRYIPDGNAAVNAALAGDLDVLAPIMSSMVSQFEGSSFTVQRAASTDVFTLAYNSAHPKLQDQRVRAALSHAINGEAIVAAFFGDGKVLGGPFTDLEDAYEDLSAVHAYDPERAKALLAEAGVSDLTLTLTVPNFYASEPLNQLVSQLADIGVTLTLNQVEFGTWLNDVYVSHDFELSYVNHAEAHDFANYANPEYYFGYANPEVQERYAAALSAADPAQATALLQEAARLVAADAPAKWLINYTPSNAIAPHVQGFPQHNTNSRINLAGVSISER